MKKELNYLALIRWEKVGHQELRSTLYNQEINPCLILAVLFGQSFTWKNPTIAFHRQVLGAPFWHGALKSTCTALSILDIEEIKFGLFL